MPFTALGLAPALARAAQTLGFAAPTPIQAQAIPVVLSGADVLATAQTGSGKTASYVLPLLQSFVQKPPTAPRRVRALVLVPTRELADQVGEVLRALAQELPARPKVAVLFGGVSINPQLMALRGGADVVVATPGRLLDVVEHNALRLGDVATLVLDEADRLLDLGFADELQRVLTLLPARRQNLFFSATFPDGVSALAGGLLHQPQRIDVPATEAHPSMVSQRAIQVDSTRRTQLLRHLIETHGWPRVLVFVATQHAATVVAGKLNRGELYATPFHGGLSQGARQEVLGEFKEKRWDVVVTTDLAARGIDIENMPVVVNYDLPRSAVDHVHRIGRTGRAGAEGQAISFVTAAQLAHWRLIEKRQGLSLPLEVLPGYEPTEVPPPPAPGGGGVKGKRPSKKDKLRAAAARADASGGQ
ncbi:MAG: DEAD/DEAH box helicase [Hydrogenophaga sp.]|nr:DEAD/DEAH box helicase [Hydrogenophaga sp.]